MYNVLLFSPISLYIFLVGTGYSGFTPTNCGLFLQNVRNQIAEEDKAKCKLRSGNEALVDDGLMKGRGN